MLKVSVIVPTLNRAWILPRAIKSVLDQTYTDFEIIVIDDASTDNTQQVVKDFSDNRIKVIKSEENKGLSASRNIGLKNSSGELIAYLDSDNLWYKSYLQISIDNFEDKTVMVYSGQNLLLVGGTKNDPQILDYKTRNEKYNPHKLVNEGNYIDVNCVVHKRSVLNEVGLFDESLKVLEDWDLFAQIAIKYPFNIKHIDQILSEYYFYLPETEKTLTNEKWQKWVEEFFGIDKKEGDELTVINKLKKLTTSHTP